MKIIEPLATIIEDKLASLSVHQRIDRCASVCYQRPPKPTEEEAQAFCRKLIERGHFPALEFAVIHLVVNHTLDVPDSKYINFHWMGDYRYLVTGSIRAFMEAEKSDEMEIFLIENFPSFFRDKYTPEGKSAFGTINIRFAEPHEIPWQHRHVAVRFIVNRAVSHMIVRHRICSILQESQRFVRYDGEKVELTFIRPEWCGGIDTGDAERVWRNTVKLTEVAYHQLLRRLKPQQARAVLPNSTKTELILQASLPEWQHIFKMRCSPAADPEMRRVMLPLREQFRERFKEVEW